MQDNIKKARKIFGILFIGALLFSSFMVAINYAKDTKTIKSISYNEFINLLEQNEISKVIITGEDLQITTNDNNEEYKGKILETVNMNDGNLVSQLEKAGVNYQRRNSEGTPLFAMFFPWIIVIVIIFFIWNFLSLKKENKKLKEQL